MVDSLVRRVNGRWVKSLRHLKAITEEAVVRAALAKEGIALPPLQTSAGANADEASAVVTDSDSAESRFAAPEALAAALSEDNPYRDYVVSRGLTFAPVPWVKGEDDVLAAMNEAGGSDSGGDNSGAGASSGDFATALGNDALVVELGDRRVVMLELSAVVGGHERIVRKHNIPRQMSVDLV